MKQLVSNPSELNEPLEVYGTTSGITEDGVPYQTEGLIFQTWAKVMTDLYKDYKANIGTVVDGQTTFIIRHDQPKELDNTMKIHWNNSVYNITKILRDNSQKAYDTVVCKLES